MHWKRVQCEGNQPDRKCLTRTSILQYLHLHNSTVVKFDFSTDKEKTSNVKSLVGMPPSLGPIAEGANIVKFLVSVANQVTKAVLFCCGHRDLCSQGCPTPFCRRIPKTLCQGERHDNNIELRVYVKVLRTHGVRKYAQFSPVDLTIPWMMAPRCSHLQHCDWQLFHGIFSVGTLQPWCQGKPRQPIVQFNPFVVSKVRDYVCHKSVLDHELDDAASAEIQSAIDSLLPFSSLCCFLTLSTEEKHKQLQV